MTRETDECLNDLGSAVPPRVPASEHLVSDQRWDQYVCHLTVTPRPDSALLTS